MRLRILVFVFAPVIASVGLTLVSSHATLAQTKLSQGFESTAFPPAGWTVQLTGTPYWERASIGAYSLGTGSAVFRFYEAPEGIAQSLISPTFTATTEADTLRFDHAYATYQTEYDSLIVEVSSDGSVFTRIVALAGGPAVGSGMVTAPPSFNSFTPTSSQWATKAYALPVGTTRIRFLAKSSYGNNLYLDNIRVSQLFAHDVGVSSILAPRYFVNVPFVETPQATITNFGLNDETDFFSVQMLITGPGGFSYSSTRFETLAAGELRVVTFSSAFNPTMPGTYTLSCFTILPTDQARVNDTVRTTVNAANYNFGTNAESGNALYFFANSLAGNQAPAKPEFRWRDTTNSRDLIVNSTAVAPISGDMDDGYFRLTGLFPGRSFRLFGTDYRDSIFISTNGIISFALGYDSFLPTALPSGATPNAAIYPLWMDLDYSDDDVTVKRLSYKVDGDILIITYARAPRFNTESSPDDYVSFQVCLRFAESHTANSFVSVQFDAAETGSAFHTAYQAHAFAHLIGVENESGTSALTYRFVTGGAPAVPGPAATASVALTFGPAYNSTVAVSPRIFLEGAYTPSATMRTDVHHLLPARQPYTASPWSFEGDESLTTPPTEMVDWILVELRSSPSASSRAALRAALLLRDGSLVDMDGITPVRFDLLPSGSYYVVLAHRNHLAVMSSAALSLSNNAAFYDFTTGQEQALGTMPLNRLEEGIFGMVSGDADGSGEINASDAAAMFGLLGETIYSGDDVNLSGIISTADVNIVYGNLNRLSQVPGVASGDSAVTPTTHPTQGDIRRAEEK